MTSHRKDTAVGTGSCIDTSRKMSTVGCQPQIIDQVPSGHDGHGAVQDHTRPKDALVELLP